jgi:hypothetical protein
MFQIDPNLKKSLTDALASGETTRTINAANAGGLNDALTLTSNAKPFVGTRPYGYVEVNGYPMAVGETCTIKPQSGDGRKYIYAYDEWIDAINTYNGIKPTLNVTSELQRTPNTQLELFTRDDMLAAFKET